MSALVNYALSDSIATVTFDDGKVNVMSLPMLTALHVAFDKAQSDHAVVLLAGRPGVFSAGFDLPVLARGDADSRAMLKAGFELAERLLAFPTPVVAACGGHALALGAFLVLSCDYRIGAAGAFKIGANEVAIGLTMPRVATEICRQRVATPHFNRAVINAEIYAPQEAVVAGFLDAVVPAPDLAATARAAAAQLAQLNLPAHAATKLRARAELLRAIRHAIVADDAEYAAR
jgi:enoyl-CoA hydratase